jgi:signal transduction histidine kinase
MSLLRVDEVIWQVKEEVLRLHPSFIVNIDFDGNLDDELKLMIRGDEQLIKTALTNLVENACKYSSDKTADVFIGSSRSGLTLQFRDKGIGIPMEEVQNIFEPFFRGSNTKNIKGHGIGLSMVKGIVKLHKGTIQLTSEENVGTSVVINLPLYNEGVIA